MVSIRGFIGAGVALLAVILVFVAMFTTGWYVIEEEEAGMSSSQSYGLSKVESEYDMGEFGSGSDELEYSDVEEDSDAIDAANMTNILGWIGVVFVFLFIIAAILGAIGILGKIGTFGKFIPLIVGVLAGLILLIAVIYFAAGFPSGLESDNDMDPGGSLGFSWILALVGAILTLVGAGLTFGIGGKKEEDAPADL